MRINSDYEIKKIHKHYIFIVDLNLGGKSVTNDAENVVKTIAKKYPGKRIFYRDSENNVDELVVKNGAFEGFKSGNPFGLR